VLAGLHQHSAGPLPIHRLCKLDHKRGQQSWRCTYTSDFLLIRQPQQQGLYCNSLQWQQHQVGRNRRCLPYLQGGSRNLC
jgi:hypothetical protein